MGLKNEYRKFGIGDEKFGFDVWVGDVNFDDMAEVASICTPVPGGVGSVTTSVLAKHLLKAAKARRA